MDEAVWDPAHDPALPATYSFEHLSGKSICKGILRQELGLPLVDESVPLVGCILYDNPNDKFELEIELIKAAQRCARGRAAQFLCVVHGKNDGFGEKLTDAKFRQDDNVKIIIAQDDALLHQVVAAADILLCPEVFEPTGQLAMIAMRYGAIPVARQVNSIMGSVIDVEDPQGDKSQATGFSFSSVKATDVVAALARALDYLKRNPERWTNLIKNCMTKDLSWDANCVEAYEGAYNSIVAL